MMGWLVDMLLPLSRRERGLLAALVFGGLPLALFFGILLPLQAERTAAQAALSEAQALYVWVQDRTGEAAALPQPESANLDGTPNTEPTTPPVAAIGLAGIEKSLIESGLRPLASDISGREDGGIVLRFDAVAFGDLVRWLDSADPDWGYQITSYRLAALPRSGIVRADLGLTPSDAPNKSP